MEPDDIPNPYEAPKSPLDAESRRSVRIVGTPPGEAPEPIRQAWVGLVLPLSPRCQGRREFRGAGVLTGPKGHLGAWLALLTRRTPRVTGYAVEGRDAVEALAGHAAHAAEWWRSNAPHVLKPGRLLVFASDVCELVRPPSGHAPLTFRGRLTEDDLVAIQWCADRLAVRRPIRWLACGMATLLAALCAAALAFSRGMRSEVPSPLLVTALMVWFIWVYLLFLLPRERAWMARRHYRRRAGEYLDTQVALSGDRVAIENDVMRSEMRWEAVGLILDVPAGLLFCNAVRQMLFWLPDRLLEDGRSRERVLSLARDRGVLVQRRV
jgi:hypothetical protein